MSAVGIKKPQGTRWSATVRMRSSLRQETKGGRCVTFLTHLRRSLTTDWEVEDISDKEERSLVGLKTGSFLQARRISKTKEKRSSTCTSKKFNSPTCLSIHIFWPEQDSGMGKCSLLSITLSWWLWYISAVLVCPESVSHFFCS